MKEKHPSQKQFEQAIEKAKKLSIELQNKIDRMEELKNRYQGQERANTYAVYAEYERVKKTALVQGITIAEAFHQSAKSSISQQNEDITDQKNQGINNKYALGARILNEALIKEIDPPFNIKKIPGISLISGGFLSVLGGFVIGSILLSVPGTVIPFFVGVAVILIGIALLPNEPYEKSIDDLEKSLKTITNALNSALNEDNKKPAQETLNPEIKNVDWQEPVFVQGRHSQQPQEASTVTQQSDDSLKLQQ